MKGQAATISAALALALYAGLAWFEGVRLFAADTRTLLVSGGLLTAFALGLALRQLWAYTFALLFLGLSALGYLVVAAYAGYSAVNSRSGSDWQGIAMFALFFAATALGLLFLVSSALFAGLIAGRGEITRGRSKGSWISSIAVAIAGVGFVGWTVGHDYVYQFLPLRHECLAGQGQACHRFANDERLPIPERRDFARRGCEADHDASCRMLAKFLTPALGSQSAEVQALSAQCRLKNVGVCVELGGHLLGIGDRENGVSSLETACRANVKGCVPAARVAEQRGERDLSESLLARGCELEDPGSCNGLLREAGPRMNPDDRSRLALKACLIGDVNDCMPLMRANLTKVCPLICDGTTENRFHTCGYCAQEALKQGKHELARQWLVSNCEKGYRWSCEELEKTDAAKRPEELDPVLCAARQLGGSRMHTARCRRGIGWSATTSGSGSTSVILGENLIF